jgi:hypothetical protein
MQYLFNYFFVSGGGGANAFAGIIFTISISNISGEYGGIP